LNIALFKGENMGCNYVGKTESKKDINELNPHLSKTVW
jgi:hypothetical protein